MLTERIEGILWTRISELSISIWQIKKYQKIMV
jgi:hypothetical protein